MKQRILFFMQGAILGGAETQLLTLCQMLHPMGYDLHVVTNTPQMDDPFFLQFKKYVKLHSAQSIRELAQMITEINPQLVQHYHNDWVGPALEQSRYKGQVVEVVHGCLHFPNDVTQTSKKHTTQIVAVSENARQFFLNKYPDWENRIATISNGVDLSFFRSSLRDYSSDRPQRILHVGRLCEGDKQYRKIIDACIQLPNRSWELWLVGSGVDSQLVHDYAVQHAPGCVKFFGFRTNVIELYRKADLYISRSESEGFGLSMAEAAACGLPLTIWDCGGVAEHFKSFGGALVAQEDEQFYKNLKGLVQNSSLRKLLGTEALALAKETLSSEKMAKAYQQLYTKLLGNTPPSPPVPRVQEITRKERTIIGLSNPSFTGVCHAVSAWTGSSPWNMNDPQLIRQALALKPDVLIIGGGAPTTLLPYLKQARAGGLKSKILLTWHSAWSFHSLVPEDDSPLIEWIQALDDKDIDGIGFVRPNQHLALQRINAFYFPNRVPKPAPQAKMALGEGWHVGLFGSGYAWKNATLASLAAFQIPQVTVHTNTPLSSQLTTFLGKNKIRTHGHHSQKKFHSLLGSMNLNLQMGLSESFNLTFCESYRLGVHCLTGPATRVLQDGGPTPWRVEDADDMREIAEKMVSILRYPDPDGIQSVNERLDLQDKKNQAQCKSVLEVLCR